MKSVPSAAVRYVKLEKSELNRAFCEYRMVVELSVSAGIVMTVSSAVRILRFVPNVCKCRHCFRLFAVKLVQEPSVHRLAILSCPALRNVYRVYQKVFVACHEVCEVSECFCVVSVCSYVDVDSAASCVVALCSGFSEPSYKPLQSLYVVVV